MIRLLQKKLGSLAVFRKASGHKPTQSFKPETANDNHQEEVVSHETQAHKATKPSKRSASFKVTTAEKKRQKDEIIQARILLNTRLYTEKLRSGNNNPDGNKAPTSFGL